MTFEQFKLLVRGGEKTHVDFKIVCNAFNKSAGDHEKAKAELVKDISAMANNSQRANYLIIGVGDDGRTFRSVTDANLTNANIQTLVRDSIHPRPFVQVHNLCWPGSPKPFAGVRFVVIQVGPHAKAAFRFARDYVQFSANYCFRKHQVWIRNGDTSDLATPEQIIALATRRPHVEAHQEFENTEYGKVPKSEQLPKVKRDLRLLFRELGHKMVGVPKFRKPGFNPPPDEFRVSVPLRGCHFVFRCCLRESMTKQYLQSVELCKSWNLEHGLLVFLRGALGKAAKVRPVEVDFDPAWGNFILSHLQAAKSPWALPNVPAGFPDLVVPVITVFRIANTLSLRQKVTNALEALESDDTLFQHIDRARRETNTQLKRWNAVGPDQFHGDWQASNRESRDGFLKGKMSMLHLLARPKKS